MLWDSRGRGIPGCRTVGSIPVDCCRIKSGVDGGGGGGHTCGIEWEGVGHAPVGLGCCGIGGRRGHTYV